MNFLRYGDSPQKAFPLRAWPQFSRVGGQIADEPPFYPPSRGGGGILKAGFRRPEKEIDVTGMRDENDVITIIMVGLGSGIIH